MLAPLFLALAAQSAPATSPDRANEIQSPPIVVIASSEAELAAAVEACRRASCPVRQDVIASARYAEYRLRAGDYHGSRAVLAAATQRVSERAAEDPAAVSQLYQALGTVADHYGDRRQQRRSTGAGIRVLRDNDAPTEAVLRARLTHVFTQASQVPRLVTDRRYNGIIDDALDAELTGIAAEAMLLRAVIARSRGESETATNLVERALAQPDVSNALARSARLLRARWAVADGRATLEQARATVGEAGIDDSVDAIIAPPRPQPLDAAALQLASRGVDTTTRSSDLVQIQWADVGYDIQPDGQIANLRVVRSSSDTLGWLSETLSSLAAQRFTTHAGPGAQQRLERYTQTADIVVPIGSFIPRRAINGRIVRLDLTPR
jgi:hypothetical protein